MAHRKSHSTPFNPAKIRLHDFHIFTILKLQGIFLSFRPFFIIIYRVWKQNGLPFTPINFLEFLICAAQFFTIKPLIGLFGVNYNTSKSKFIHNKFLPFSWFLSIFYFFLLHWFWLWFGRLIFPFSASWFGTSFIFLVLFSSWPWARWGRRRWWRRWTAAPAWTWIRSARWIWRLIRVCFTIFIWSWFLISRRFGRTRTLSFSFFMAFILAAMGTRSAPLSRFWHC